MGSLSVSRLLALAALFIVAIAETGRIPVDNPDTHLELTMAHEGMLLEYSGRPLGLLLWGTHLKQLVILSLLGGLFFPWGMARELGALPLALGARQLPAEAGAARVWRSPWSRARTSSCASSGCRSCWARPACSG